MHTIHINSFCAWLIRFDNWCLCIVPLFISIFVVSALKHIYVFMVYAAYGRDHLVVNLIIAGVSVPFLWWHRNG